jgi:hypothetical protein
LWRLRWLRALLLHMGLLPPVLNSGAFAIAHQEAKIGWPGSMIDPANPVFAGTLCQQLREPLVGDI